MAIATKNRQSSSWLGVALAVPMNKSAGKQKSNTSTANSLLAEAATMPNRPASQPNRMTNATGVSALMMISNMSDSPKYQTDDRTMPSPQHRAQAQMRQHVARLRPGLRPWTPPRGSAPWNPLRAGDEPHNALSRVANPSQMNKTARGLIARTCHWSAQRT